MDTTQNTQSAEQMSQELVSQFELYQRVIHYTGRNENEAEWPEFDELVRCQDMIVDAELLGRFLSKKYQQYHEDFFARITDIYEHPLHNAPASANADDRITLEWSEWNTDFLMDMTVGKGLKRYLRESGIVLSLIAQVRLFETTLWFQADDLCRIACHLKLNINAGRAFAITAVVNHLVYTFRAYSGADQLDA